VHTRVPNKFLREGHHKRSSDDLEQSLEDDHASRNRPKDRVQTGKKEGIERRPHRCGTEGGLPPDRKAVSLAKILSEKMKPLGVDRANGVGGKGGYPTQTNDKRQQQGQPSPHQGGL
jgi:hypothetical protein